MSGEKSLTCIFCSQPAQGNYSMRRDGFGRGPVVPLCDGCGIGHGHNLPEVFARIKSDLSKINMKKIDPIIQKEEQTARAEDRKYMRRHFSAMFMQSLLINGRVAAERTPMAAISLANFLISELEKEEAKV